MASSRAAPRAGDATLVRYFAERVDALSGLREQRLVFVDRDPASCTFEQIPFCPPEPTHVLRQP